MKIKTKQLNTITVIDPDTQLEVSVVLFKMETGGIVGIDESFLANTDEPVYSPFDVGVEMDVE